MSVCANIKNINQININRLFDSSRVAAFFTLNSARKSLLLQNLRQRQAVVVQKCKIPEIPEA